ncbi:membrane transport protein-domain-containing protein [Pisolithus marmoratus]|nr:membrane transport protein-domain-containing protein [Pisolithus marmoratus]
MHIASSPVLPLLYTIFQSILQVFLLCLTGYYLAWSGIADKRIQRAINNINIALFTPALLFSKVAYFLTLEKLRELWVIPLIFLLVCGPSGLIANVLARAYRLKRSQRNFAIAASVFMNSNSLPVALMQSLVTTVPGLKWTPDDDQDAMFGRALTYLVVYSTLGMILRWSYGVQLLSHGDTEEPEWNGNVVPGRQDKLDTNKIGLPSPIPDTASRLSAQNALRAQLYARHRPQRHFGARIPLAGFGDEFETDSEETLVIRPPRQLSYPSTPSTAFTPSSHDYAVDVHSRPDTALLSYRTTSLSRHLRTLIHRLRTRCIRVPTLPPPLFASLLALLFTLPPLQAILKSDVMVPVKGALSSAGACSVPLTLAVLGGWFWEDNIKEKKDAKQGHRSGADDSIKAGSVGRSSCVPSGDEGEPDQSGVETELGDNEDSGHMSRSPSLSSLFSVLQDIWKMTPIRGKQRQTGPIRLAVDDDDEQGHDVDIEAGDHAIWRMRSSTSLKGKQKDRHNNADDADADNETAKRQFIRSAPLPGETTTIVVTLLSRMFLTPLLVLPLMAFLKMRDDEESGVKVFDDPVFVVAMILLVASPPALTLAQISQRATAESKPKFGVIPATTASTSTVPSQIPISTHCAEPAPALSETLTAIPAPAPEQPKASPSNANSPFERLFSRTVFWAYCVLTPPVTIVCVLLGIVFMSL